jgi:hypothetical protein
MQIVNVRESFLTTLAAVSDLRYAFFFLTDDADSQRARKLPNHSCRR